MFQRQTHCANRHPLTGETKQERACDPCRRMRARRHRLNNTARAQKARATNNAWRRRQPKTPRKPPVKPPGTTPLAVCRRGHDRTDPRNLSKVGQCLPCRRLIQKAARCDEPLEDMRRRPYVHLGEPLPDRARARS